MLERIKGTGKVFLEESDLPAGEHKIGGLAVTVKAGAELPRSTSGLDDSLVPFVVGALRFDDGDSITITNVQGTSKTFEPGGTYWIDWHIHA